MNFAVAVALLAAGIALFALGMRYFPCCAALLTAIMLVVFPIWADSSDWNWFDWLKRYSLLISAFLWAVLSAFPDHRWSRRFVRAMPAILALNVLEAAALDLPGPSPLNGILLVCVALCGPIRLKWDSVQRRFGFRNAYWQAAYFLTLARLYVLNKEFENGFVAALLVIILASLFCIFERDTHNYLTWRLFTIYPVLLQDALLPKISDAFYPEFLHAENRVKWQNTLFFRSWLALNVVAVALMIFHRIRAARRSSVLPDLQPQPGTQLS